MLKQALHKLIKRESLLEEEIESLLDSFLDPHHHYQTCALLVLLKAKGETPLEIASFAKGFLKRATLLDLPFETLDIVGTGGDGFHTLNISTASAFLIASLGIPVAKHGNRSVSSLTGSADVLEALGGHLTLAPSQVEPLLREVGFAFLMAPHYHPVLKVLSPIRKGLGLPTFLNFLGPLLNPAKAPYRIVGVPTLKEMDLMASSLQSLGLKKGYVVHGEGLDEASTLGPFHYAHITPLGIEKGIIDPLAFGLKRGHLSDLQGEKASYNAERIKRALQGEKSPFADTLILNAALALRLLDKVSSLQEGVLRAKKAHEEGLGAKVLEKWIHYDATR